MNNNKFSLSMYLFALACGLGSGLCFTKAAYHKGRYDAYKHCRVMLLDTLNATNKLKQELEDGESE